MTGMIKLNVVLLSILSASLFYVSGLLFMSPEDATFISLLFFVLGIVSLWRTCSFAVHLGYGEPITDLKKLGVGVPYHTAAQNELTSVSNPSGKHIFAVVSCRRGNSRQTLVIRLPITKVDSFKGKLPTYFCVTEYPGSVSPEIAEVSPCLT